MNINWLLFSVITLNLLFSTMGDVFAKYWGITSNQHWLYGGLALNAFTVFFYMYSIRLGGLVVAPAIMLLITLAISVMLGFFFFHENVSLSQWIGIGTGFLSILLISGIFLPSR